MMQRFNRAGDMDFKALLDHAERSAMAWWNEGVDAPVLPAQIAAIHALRDDKDGALDWLQRAYERGWIQPLPTRLDPMLASLRTDARFTQLIKRMDDGVSKSGRNSTEIRELLRKTVPGLPAPH